MSTYVIGDLHGCFDQLIALLDKIHFDQTKDALWFTGDYVNGGPKSLETLRFIKSLGNTSVCLLGNHDLTLLAIASGEITAPNDRKIGFESVLKAPDLDELINWLRKQPLIHFDQTLNTLLVHAGIPPGWDANQALTLAKEVETILQSDNVNTLYRNMYGNEPSEWNDSLQGWPRIRFIINCFTRMRFCDDKGSLELMTKGEASNTPKGYLPWFQHPHRKTAQTKVIFGHWAALQGEVNTPNIVALDTGCVWGNYLSAYRLEDESIFQVKCPACSE